MDMAAYCREKGWLLGQAVEWGLLGVAFHPNYKTERLFLHYLQPHLDGNWPPHRF